MAATEVSSAAKALAARDVVDLLWGLGTVAADALYLIYFRGLTQTEVAGALGIPREVIGQHVVLGMRALASQLQTYST